MSDKTGKLRFIHLRLKDKNGEITPMGGVTIAYDTVGEGEAEDVVFTLAHCSKKDHFDKARGRQIAEGRWDKWMRTKPKELIVTRLDGRGPVQAIMEEFKGSVFNP